MDGTRTEADGAPSVGPQPTRARGDSIGRFVVLDRIGSGAMGVVYSAYDPQLDRRVAIKILHDRQTKGMLPSHGRRALLREAQAIAKVVHPNVIGVHDVGESEGEVFLAMELVDGQTLKRWVGHGPRDRDEILRTFVAAGRGLAAAHAAGIVHRDFKPDNVLVGHDGRVQVTDFGLARPGRSSSGASTSGPHEAVPSVDRRPTARELPAAEAREAGVELESSEYGPVIGTPAYMAPEQHFGRHVDARADQFSFCVALYEALYGERPFAAETSAGLAFRILEGKVEPPPAGTHVPPWIRRVLVRGLAAEPNDRFASIDELLEQLEADPHRTRRRVITYAGALSLAGGLVAIGQWAAPVPASPCGGAEAKRTEVYDDASSERIAEAFARTERPFASDAAARVDDGLQRYLDDWLGRHVDACEATRVRGEQSDALMDARIRCLDRGLRAAGALVERLEDADVRAVEHAVQAVEALPRLDRCDDADWVLRRNVVPDDPETAARVAEIEADLLHAGARRDAGQYGDALRELQTLLPQAEALGDEPLTAQVYFELGAAESEDGRYTDAATHLEEAYFRARQAGRGDLAARAAASLVFVHGRRLAHHDVGLAWVRHAQVELERDPDPLTSVRLLNSTGSVRLAKGDYADALSYYERALRRAKAELDPDGYSAALAMNNIGLAKMDLGDNDGAAEALTAAHAMFVRALGPSHPHTALPLANLASIAFGHGDYDRAIELDRQALAIREPSLEPDHPAVARTLNNLGNALFFAGHHEEALAHLQRALDAIERRVGPDHPNVATCLNNVGMVERARGELEAADAHYRRALQIREATLGPEHLDVAASHVNIGSLRRDQHDDRDALRHYEIALRMFEELLGPDDPRLASALTGIGQTMLSLGRAGDAIAPLQRALALPGRDAVDVVEVAETRWALARALRRTGDDGGARDVAEQARASLEGLARAQTLHDEIAAFVASK